MVVIKKINSSFIKVTGNLKERIVLSDAFKRYVPNYKLSPKFKEKKWDGTIKFFHPSTGRMPYGLIHDLIDVLNKNKFHYKIESEELSEYIKEKQYEVPDIDLMYKGLNEKYAPRDYQNLGAEESLKYSRGLLEYATGSGKTLTLFLVVNYIINKYKDKKILVVVTNKSLLYQFVSDFINYGLSEDKIGKFYGDCKDLTKQVTIGTWQSLSQNGNEEFLSTITHLFCDECHMQAATCIKSVTQHCVNTELRIGCTGSLPEDECSRMTVFGSFGRILNTVKSHKLITEDKVLTPIKVNQVVINYPYHLERQCFYNYGAEKEIIKTYQPRKEIVKKIIKNHPVEDNFLLLFDTIQFGKDCFDYLESSLPDKKFFFVYGKVDVEEREKIRNEVNERGGIVVVASSGVFSVGVDIQRIHSVILLWGGKSTIRLLQSIGRAIRKHETKDEAIVYDLVDKLHYGREHAKEREELYINEKFPYQIYKV